MEPEKQYAPKGGYEHSKALQERLDAIDRKDYAAADKIRDDMIREGVELYDVKHPVTGERFTFYKDSGLVGRDPAEQPKLTIFPLKVSAEEFAVLMREYKIAQGAKKK